MESEGEIAEAEKIPYRISVEDKRTVKDEIQVASLTERLETDKVAQNLENTYKLLGDYSQASPEELSIQLVDGSVGEGTIKGRVIEIQLPAQKEAVTQMRGFVEQKLHGESDEKIDSIAQELEYALVASTALHEGVHGLLASKPGSQFAQDFERVSGEANEQGKQSTLLDEGLTYAVQGLYAPELENIGGIKPISRESEPYEVYQRKTLGEKLRPTVQSYIEQGKIIDDEFFAIASELMKHL